MNHNLENPKKILIVSERPVIRESIAVQLRKQGFTVKSLSCMTKAKDAASWQPEIVVTSSSQKSEANRLIESTCRKLFGPVPLIALAESKDTGDTESLFDAVVAGRYSVGQIIATLEGFSKVPRGEHSLAFRSRARHLTRPLELLPA